LFASLRLGAIRGVREGVTLVVGALEDWAEEAGAVDVAAHVTVEGLQEGKQRLKRKRNQKSQW